MNETLDSYWQQDSTSVQRALARLIIDPGVSNDLEAIEAATAYREHDGDPSFILYYLASGSTQRPRTAFGLRAIGKIRDVHTNAVVAHGCHAAWFIAAISRIPPNHPFAFEVPQALESFDILCQSFRLLGSEKGQVLKTWIAKVDEHHRQSYAVRLTHCLTE